MQKLSTALSGKGAIVKHLDQILDPRPYLCNRCPGKNCDVRYNVTCESEERFSTPKSAENVWLRILWLCVFVCYGELTRYIAKK